MADITATFTEQFGGKDFIALKELTKEQSIKVEQTLEKYHILPQPYPDINGIVLVLTPKAPQSMGFVAFKDGCFFGFKAMPKELGVKVVSEALGKNPDSLFTPMND